MDKAETIRPHFDSEDNTECRELMASETEARLRAIFRSSPVGIVLVDLETDEILEANPAYCQIVGRSHDEIMQQGWKGLTHPEDIDEGLSKLNDLRQGKTSGYGLTKRYIRPDGEIVWAKIEINLIPANEKPINPQYLVSVVDVTERKNVEHQLEQKNTELERFTYTVSHELKSPLVTINGFLGLLQQDLELGDSGKIQQDMQMISSAVRTMGQQLDNLLELSRVGRIVHPSETFSLADLCRGLVERMVGVIDQYGGRVEIAPDLPEVFADPVRIREVFQNLIENALKFSAEINPPRVRIDAVLEDDRVLCRIADNGPGIEPRYHERIFELFDRLNTQIPGTGIGLSLVKRNIEIHQGEIWIESNGDGGGAVFCFTLPRP